MGVVMEPDSYAPVAVERVPHRQLVEHVWKYMDTQPSLAGVILAAVAATLAFLYWLALPRPIPGIPYNASSARKLLGDLPAMVTHITQEEGTFVTYLLNTVQSLHSPLVQVFIRPLSRPLLVLADFREAQDVLGHRGRDFDRSSSLGDLVRGIGPDHHVLLKTNDLWKAQRRLIQDLMTPGFLNKNAGPAMHQSMMILLDLWREKSRIADGRPWDARDDINWETLDSVHAFSYGASFGHSASKPTLEVIRALDLQAIKELKGKGAQDEPIIFPKGQVDSLVEATMTLSHTTKEVHGSPMPKLHWAYIMRKPRIRRATKIKETHVANEITSAIKRLEEGKAKATQSAVDHMVAREKRISGKEGRKPEYFSRVMMDELFGFVVAGHDTTSSSMCWAVKHLADYQPAQSMLRDTLYSAYIAAKLERRNPSIEDITNAQLPYLDAFLEEVMRCANTVPVVDRQAIVDTELLGHRIPKGTVVSCLVTGPSMTSQPFEIEESRRHVSPQVHKDSAKLSWNTLDMTDFKPERWLDSGKFDPFAGPQLAFGLGTRQCYGRRLAYLKLRIGIVLLVWNFEVLPCPPALSGHQPVLVMSNEPKDCYVRLREMEYGNT